MQLRAGDIVAMYLVVGGTPSLGHSLIAETPTVWVSANNAGTLGVGTRRSQIETTQNLGVFAGHQVGLGRQRESVDAAGWRRGGCGVPADS